MQRVARYELHEKEMEMESDESKWLIKLSFLNGRTRVSSVLNFISLALRPF